MIQNERESGVHLRVPAEIIDSRNQQQTAGLSVDAQAYPDGSFGLSAATIQDLAASVGRGDEVRFSLLPRDFYAEIVREQQLSFADGGVLLDQNKRELFVHGLNRPTTFKEFGLLAFLGVNAGISLSRDSIGREVWGSDFADTWKENPKSAKTVDIHLFRCRQKLGDYSWILRTVRSIGYMLDDTLPVK